MTITAPAQQPQPQPQPQPPSPSPAPPTKKGGALGVVALVFAALFFIPFAPLLGLILGIIALVTAPPGKKTVPIVAVCVAPLSFFLLQGMMAAIAIPAFMKYVRRAKTVEAQMNVRRVAEAVAMRLAEGGATIADTGWAPSGSACEHPGGRYPHGAGAFDSDAWRALGLGAVDVSFYQLRVHPEGDEVVVEARGDLDCDGDFARFERRVRRDGTIGPLRTEREIE
jgi:hypothetical protein